MGKTKTLTEGTPWKQILLFSIPIFWGNIFQLLYSLVDTKIVGSTLGTEALAAVGSVSTLHTLMTGFLNGLTLGFSLITAMCFGADNMKRLKKSFAMTIELGVLTTAVLVVVLMFVLQPLLHLLNVPEEQFAMSYAYISVLIVGLFATVLYNLCANTLRAIGDSLTPLLFLILATVSNIGLDYLFILEFHMGVQGAAYATVLAQLISVVLCFVRIFRKFPILHLQKSDFRPEKELIVEMYKSGLSMGLMSCLVSIGTIMLQSAINTFGTTVIVAHTAARKVFEIMSLPMSVLGSAMATYCGQNYGAKRFDRIRQGIRASLLIAAIWSVAVFIICHTVEGALIRFVASTTDAEVIYWGSMYLKVDMSFIIVCGVIVILRNSMQGFGDRVIPVFSSCIELAGKIIFAFVFAPVFAYWGIIWAEPVVWIAMVIPLIVKVVHTLKKEI
ncbi:multidrug transporter MatE [Eubacterium ramulus]|jgi:Na+-driven multidrug efflux pump|uniref:Probable multidrug resistance protein NorM n=1 Tax=Eubacterium ramulus TaxID=39490 RepID=A0A2V1JRA7_EUBRA|nr:MULTISPECIES: MATE family efflux transporter [Clostridia]MBS5190772.1 MATE family efflux transporter [Lachnospiraceae bacterium]PWE87500.1 multidrug transporter MatE [Eubacterium ramulus]RHV65317.1 MATE family efflux transporter [Roseburia sp. OM02-15]